mgnify:CR=1 FL=1
MKFTKTLIFCFSSLLFSLYGFAQEAVINGKVMDENGLFVPGATIAVKGTKVATSTDFDGSFKIKAPSNGTLAKDHACGLLISIVDCEPSKSSM